MIQFDLRIFFQMGWLKPPTRMGFSGFLRKDDLENHHIPVHRSLIPFIRWKRLADDHKFHGDVHDDFQFYSNIHVQDGDHEYLGVTALMTTSTLPGW